MSNKYLDLDGVKYLCQKILSNTVSNAFETLNINLTTSDNYDGPIYSKITIIIDNTPFEYNYEDGPLAVKIPAGATYKIQLSSFEYYYVPQDFNEYTAYEGFSRTINYEYKYAGYGCHFVDKDLNIVEFDERIYDKIVGIVILNDDTNNVVVPLFYPNELYDLGYGDVIIGDKEYSDVIQADDDYPMKYYLGGAIARGVSSVTDFTGLEGAYVVDGDIITDKTAQVEKAMQDLFGKQNTDSWLNKWPDSGVLNFCKYGFKELKGLNSDWWMMTFRDIYMVKLNLPLILDMAIYYNFSQYIIGYAYYGTLANTSTLYKEKNTYTQCSFSPGFLNGVEDKLPTEIFSVGFYEEYDTCVYSPTTYYNVTKSIPNT